MGLQGLKKAIKREIDARAAEIMAVSQKIYETPETGYKEQKTAAIVVNEFKKFTQEITVLEDIPGVKVTLDTGRPGPGVAILGELDALVCPEHPHSDPVTGAVHACGHNHQVASMLGAYLGIAAAGDLSGLSGKIHFIAVPAEECIELGYRKQLREKGVIKYFSGKAELLYRGLFDDVDLAMLLHSFTEDYKFGLPQSSNGCIVKRVKYIGRAAHAGGSPHKGINALYAANLGLMAVNSIRETFQEEDYIRVHPIITKGGDSVNVIPSEVLLETFVRGKTLAAILKANERVDRALLGGAISLGAQVEIEDFGGYLPLEVSAEFRDFGEKIMTELVSREEIYRDISHGTGSTDMGDLSALMPVLQPSLGGVAGSMHGSDYRVQDPAMVVLGAKFLATAAVELLAEDAKKALALLAGYKPIFKTKEEYFAALDGLFSKKLLPQG